MCADGEGPPPQMGVGRVWGLWAALGQAAEASGTKAGFSFDPPSAWRILGHSAEPAPLLLPGLQGRALEQGHHPQGLCRLHPEDAEGPAEVPGAGEPLAASGGDQQAALAPHPGRAHALALAG